jgi:integrase
MPAAQTSRDRVLSDDELRRIWCAAERLGYPYGALVQLLMVSGQRRNEVAGMRWGELNGSLWTLDATRTKNGRVHEVPLPTAAKAILASVPRIRGSDYVLTTNGLSQVTGFASAKSKLDAAVLALAQERAAERRQNAAVEVASWRFHDLRRTTASGLARLGQPPHVIEAVLNHRSGVISGVSATYNRHDYRNEKLTALQVWGEHVTSDAPFLAAKSMKRLALQEGTGAISTNANGTSQAAVPFAVYRSPALVVA